MAGRRCKGAGLSPITGLALAAALALVLGGLWLLQQPGVTAPNIGPRTLAQLEAALVAEQLELSAQVLAKLDAIFPGYKTSPEDFAW